MGAGESRMQMIGNSAIEESFRIKFHVTIKVSVREKAGIFASTCCRLCQFRSGRNAVTKLRWHSRELVVRNFFVSS